MFADITGKAVETIEGAMAPETAIGLLVLAQVRVALQGAQTMEDLRDAAEIAMDAQELVNVPERWFTEAEKEVKRGDRLTPDTLVAFVEKGGDIAVKAMQIALSPRERMLERHALPHRMVIGDQEYVGYVVEG